MSHINVGVLRGRLEVVDGMGTPEQVKEAITKILA
jgi:hypothetical protein